MISAVMFYFGGTAVKVAMFWFIFIGLCCWAGWAGVMLHDHFAGEESYGHSR
jgi:hypothetical protein